MAVKKAVQVIISGRVQGVCFRMETQRTAKSFNVSGWARNLSDGTVEAVFEGDGPDVDAVLSWCKKGPEMASVAGVQIREIDLSNEEKREFIIKYL